MSGKTEIGIIIITVILLAGCSAGRKSRTAGVESVTAGAGLASTIGAVRSYNITDQGFVLTKGRIEMEGTAMDGSFGLIARMNANGDLFASVRGPLGIELLRILSVSNDIAVIDRINRITYTGKKDDTMRRNGLPEDIIRIIFGDIPEFNPAGIESVEGNMLLVKAGDIKYEREISICLDEMKICRERIRRTGVEGLQIELGYFDFRMTEGKKYASVITMDEKIKMFHVKLNIEEMTPGYNSQINFNLPSYVIKPL